MGRLQYDVCGGEGEPEEEIDAERAIDHFPSHVCRGEHGVQHDDCDEQQKAANEDVIRQDHARRIPEHPEHGGADGRYAEGQGEPAQTRARCHR